VLAPAAVLAVVTPKPDPYSLIDTLWTASIYLEAVAILPQLFLVRRTGEVENLTSNYIAAMGAYRFFYILNWIYRYATEPEYYGIPGNAVVWLGGIVQTALYAGIILFFFPLSLISHS
jgi:ER lumen protein retaining receptor